MDERAPSFRRASLHLFMVSLLTAGVSAATVKLIAVLAGPDGMGLFSLFRQLGGLLTMSVGLGYGVMLTRQMAAAGGLEAARDAFRSSLAVSAIQAAAFALAALLAPGLLASLFFSGHPEVGVLELRIVITMAFINLSVQNLLALLRADLDVTAQAAVNLSTALASLALIIPLLWLGPAGLAVNVGSGGLVGGALAAVVLLRRHPPGALLGGFRAAHFRDVLSRTGDSLALTFPQVLLLLAFLWVTVLVARGGMEAAGELGAALLVSDAFTQVVLVSARSAAIARLARAADSRAEAEAFRQASEFLVAVAGAAAGAIVCAAPLAVFLLYSRDFDAAPLLIRCFAVVFPLEAIWWAANSTLTARADFRKTAVLDTALSLVLFALAGLASADGRLSPLEACLCIVGAKAALAGIYVSRIAALPMGAAVQGAAAAAVLAGAVALIHAGHSALGLSAAAAVSIVFAAKLVGRRPGEA